MDRGPRPGAPRPARTRRPSRPRSGDETPGLAEVVAAGTARCLADQRPVDFDEQIARRHRAAARRPGGPAAAQRACRVLLVDEFQDLTPAHVLLLRLLAGARRSTCSASATTTRRSTATPAPRPSGSSTTRRCSPAPGRHPLEVNYRCPPAVVTARRQPAHPQPAPAGQAHRAGPRARRRAGRPHRGASRRRRRPPPSRPSATPGRRRRAGEVAVLARVNAALAPVQVALRADGVPCARRRRRLVLRAHRRARRAGVAAAGVRRPGRLRRRGPRRDGPPRQPAALAAGRSSGSPSSASVSALRALADRLDGRARRGYVNALDDAWWPAARSRRPTPSPRPRRHRARPAPWTPSTPPASDATGAATATTSTPSSRCADLQPDAGALRAVAARALRDPSRRRRGGR